MKSEHYNEYLDAIKYAYSIKDSDKRKTLLLDIKARILVDYGLNDADAKILVKKC